MIDTVGEGGGLGGLNNGRGCRENRGFGEDDCLDSGATEDAARKQEIGVEICRIQLFSFPDSYLAYLIYILPL